MSNAVTSRLGQVRGAGDSRALFLDIFGGEVLTAFERNLSMRDKHMTRSITEGRSARFPATFKVGTRYHTPGEEILGQVIQHNEVTITIDDILISDTFIANIDEAMNHYDVRSIYSNEIGLALAEAYDRNVTRVIGLAARTTQELFVGDGAGAALVNAAFNTTASTLFSGISQAKQTLEEKDVPVGTQPVFAAFRPAQWYLMARSDTAINRDLSGTNGSLAQSVLQTVDGVQIVKSNALPFGVNESALSTIPAKYRANWTNTRGLVWVPMAAATVSLMDVQMESQYDMRRQGTLMLGKYLVGHGPLRAKCAVELAIA
jgi:hypothetical protein